MIIVKLWGGLGNQLFQYAFGYAMSKKTGKKLCFDTEFYNNQAKQFDKRKVRLECMSIPQLEIIDRPNAVRILENKYINHIIRYMKNFRVRVAPDFIFEKEVLRNGSEGRNYCFNKGYFDGYWQSASYFQEYKKDLCEQFQYNTDFSAQRIELNKGIESCNSVAVHIRRGDVMAHNGLKNIRHDLSLDYYHSAIQLIKSRVDNPVFFIFSDDIDWVKSNFTPNDCTIKIVDIKDRDGDICDMWSIAKCRHGVMSASTFSWWGNWLRESEGSIVIAPSGRHFNDLFFEDSWVRV